MENPAATGLPKVDALPNGFVNGITGRPGCPTLLLEQENYRVHDISEHCDQNESIQESATSEADISLCNDEKSQKPSNFPLPLSEMDNYDALAALLDENDAGCEEQLTPHSADPCSEALVRLAGQSEDECKQVSTEGHNLRLELSAKCEDAIKEVSNKLEHQKDECLSQLKENEM